MREKLIYIVAFTLIFIFPLTSNTEALSKIEKIAGKNIYEVSANIASKKTYNSAVVVNMDNSVADALSASALSGELDGVILPVSKNSIPNETLNKLSGLKKIYIIGLENAVSENVEKELSKYATVKRIGGDDRYETSLKVANELKNISGTQPQNIIYANGKTGEADVVSISSISYRDSSPILLTNGKIINNEMKEFSQKAKNIYAIGGEKVIPESLYKNIGATERIRGNTRFETNEKIINKFYSTKPEEYHIVNSSDYKTAIVLSSISEESPIALVEDNTKATVIKGAEKLISAGTISENEISRAVSIAGGIENYDYSWTSKNYIAHAMGGIDGKAYTNSYEAMEYNYKRGHKVFEADIINGGYGDFLVWHSFDSDTMKEMNLPEKYSTNRPDAEEFKKLKPYGKYTTMVPSDIFKYMSSHRDMYLVIDLKSKSEYDTTMRYSSLISQAKKYGVIDRIIPQAYSKESYNQIMKLYSFESVVFTCYNLNTIDVNDITNFCIQNGIDVITVDGSKYSTALVNRCKEYGIKLYMNTYNDINEVNKYKSKGVYGFYTDFLV